MMGAMIDPPTVTVARADLEYLLAHYADEVHGTPVPDREHWRLPLLGEACARLAGALAATGTTGSA